MSDCTGCQNLSNMSHQGTREMCQIVQDVRIHRFYFSEQKYFRTIHFCRMSQDVKKTEVSDCTVLFLERI